MSSVCFVIAAYNASATIVGALQSLIDQCSDDIAIIVVDDGSTDETSAKIKEAGTNHRNFKIIRNHTNLGLTKSLNIAINSTNADWIARADADDINLPRRVLEITKAIKYCNDLDLFGTWALSNEGRLIKRPLKQGQIKYYSYFANPFLHPTVVFKRETFLELGGYNEQFRIAQDYELWCRYLRKSKRIKNKRIPTIVYSKNPYSVSQYRRKEQDRAKQLILHEHYKHLFGKDTLGKLIEEFIHQIVYNHPGDGTIQKHFLNSLKFIMVLAMVNYKYCNKHGFRYFPILYAIRLNILLVFKKLSNFKAGVSS